MDLSELPGNMETCPAHLNVPVNLRINLDELDCNLTWALAQLNVNCVHCCWQSGKTTTVKDNRNPDQFS